MKTGLPIGDVRWRGGTGKPGMKGGWGYFCRWCSTGNGRSADPRKSVSYMALMFHVAAKHAKEQITLRTKEKVTVAEWMEAHRER